jgi:hypothetical protein
MYGTFSAEIWGQQFSCIEPRDTLNHWLAVLSEDIHCFPQTPDKISKRYLICEIAN